MPKINFKNSFTRKIQVEQSLLYLTLTGNASAIDMLNTYFEAIDFAKHEGANKILIDMRDLYMDYESFDMLNVMNILEKRLTPFKVARLINKQFHKNMVLEEIALNKNLLLKNFESENEANMWLAA